MKQKLETADIEALCGLELDREIAERIGLQPVGHEDGVLWVRDGVMNFPFSPTSDWNQFGPLQDKYRIALYPTIARGSGAGIGGSPGWMGSAIPGAPFVDQHALTAGCRALVRALLM